jgi:ATP-dependent helicase Lhr and Lhr-like helicase
LSADEQLHPALLHHVVNTLGWLDLRPLQEQAVGPVLSGADALLLAPTAGGKTEAAVFPLLSAMALEGWSGLSVLYVCPLRALLNNLEPRLESYAGWLGRRVARWHGDVPDSRRAAILRDPPDLLLTTPESLEAMLIGSRVSQRTFFADLRAVVVDEVHAFAGDDRGWHLLAVLERLATVAGGPLQRIGLSATVGNPGELLRWLQGSAAGSRPAVVVAPAPETSPTVDAALDYVGSLQNAATVIAALHRGQKRLVFCDSRRRVEELALVLRERGVEVFVSHSSLSADERRRAEAAFVDARDCVIVATSTLELGIDVGDLDRVIQIDAPRTVSSFLQRLGRTGRRADTVRNCLFLATDEDALLQAAGLLHLWGAGFVEPVVPPPSPRHLVAQQVLAFVLQEGRVGNREVLSAWGDLPLLDDSSPAVLHHLVTRGMLESEDGMLFIGPTAERLFGRRYFRELTSSFTADPEFTVLHGRAEIGAVHPLAVMAPRADEPLTLLLAGHSWDVEQIDWRRRRCYVVPAPGAGRARWQGSGSPLSFAMVRAQRDVVLGAEPPAALSARATDGLDRLRDELGGVVTEGGTVLRRAGSQVTWWTWAGGRANATLAAALSAVVEPAGRLHDRHLRVRDGVDTSALTDAVRRAGSEPMPAPAVAEEAVRGLKFADALPAGLAARTLAERLADVPGAERVLAERRVDVR